jgi:hypothetical protein
MRRRGVPSRSSAGGRVGWTSNPSAVTRIPLGQGFTARPRPAIADANYVTGGFGRMTFVICARPETHRVACTRPRHPFVDLTPFDKTIRLYNALCRRTRDAVATAPGGRIRPSEERA